MSLFAFFRKQNTSKPRLFPLVFLSPLRRLVFGFYGCGEMKSKPGPFPPLPPRFSLAVGAGLEELGFLFFSAVRQTSSRLALSGTLCFFFFGRGSKVKEQIWTTAGACLSPAGSSWEEAILKRQSREEGAGLAASPFPTLAF